jgi:hypothetical protein
MKKIQHRPVLETYLLAAVSGILALWMLKRLFGSGLNLAAAGCAYDAALPYKIACATLRNSGYSGFAALIALATAIAGIYGAVQIIRGQKSGYLTLIVLYALQTVRFEYGAFSYYLPTALNFYYQHPIPRAGGILLLNINFLTFLLLLFSVGRYRNDYTG